MKTRAGLSPLLLAALAGLFAATATAQVESYRAIEKTYLDNVRRFRWIRNFEDFEDLEALSRRLQREVNPEGLSREELTDYLCLDLLVRKGLEGVRRFERRRTDPGMALPTSDPFDRAARPKDGDVAGTAAGRIRDGLTQLAVALERAPEGWDRVEKRFARTALERADALRLRLGENLLLLLRNLPARKKASWKAVGVRVVKALDAYRICLEAVHDSLPDPTEEEHRGIRKRELDHRILYEYLVDHDSDELLRRATRFFHDTVGELEREARKIDPDKSWQALLREAERDHPPRGKLVEWADRAARKAVRFVETKDLMTLTDEGRAFDVVRGNPDGPTPFAHYRPRRGKRKAAYVVVPCGEKWSDGRVKDHLRANNVHWLQVVALHEAVPGHHFQFSKAAEVKSPIRRLFRCAAYYEGWGLYCEEMMGRHGYYGPKAKLTQLKMKLWRAARVLSAVGMNHGGLTEEGAAELLQKRVLFKAMHAKREAKMHRNRPWYFVAYSVGFWQIERLRKALMKHWGEGYSEKRFHDAFLAFGPIPVPIIEKVLLWEGKSARSRR
ncbi:MAG: DUF885 family protein [Planctomycetota bacterium]|jgi:hypothetical protein